MAKATPIIASFNGGEFSPDLYGRVDLEKYFSGCLTVQNMVLLPSGAARSMPGSYFVAKGKTLAKKIRMVEFAFSTIQTYILEFGNLYIRFYKDQGQIVVAYAAWATSTSYVLGNLVTSGGNDYRCIVAHTSGTFATDLAAGKWEACSPVTGETDLAYEIPSPYLEADLPNIIFRQSADTLYIVHPSYPPKTLTRSAHTSWTLADYVCLKYNAAQTITGITKANPAVVTVGSIGSVTNGDYVYISGVVGMTEVNNRYFTVAGLSGSTFQLSGVDSSGYGAWSSGGTASASIFGPTDCNPSCCEFFEQRFLLAATNNRPQTVWGSASADYVNFKLLSTDDSAAVEYTIPNRGKVDRIRWMVAQTAINLGTYGNIQKLGPSDDNGLSQTNVKAAAQISIGCKAIDALLTNDSVVYVTKDGKSIREVYYDYLSDKYISPPDITLLANHIFKGDTAALSGVIDMAYQQSPMSILWALRADGVLCGMVYEKAQKVYGWFRVVMDGAIESVAVISNDDEEDEVWVSVKRTIGGVDYRYIEYFMPHDIYGEITDAFHVESGLTFDGGAAVTDISAITKANPAVVTHTGHHGFTNGQMLRFTGIVGMTEINCSITQAFEVQNKTDHTYELKGIDSSAYTAYISGGSAQVVAKTVSGLSHLEGKSVEIVVDGAHHTAVTVASGAITLTSYGNKIHAGLFTNRILAPLPIIAGAQDGTAHGRIKRISEIAVHFNDTFGCSVATDPDDTSTYEEISFGSGVNPVLFSGIKTDIEVKSDFEAEGKLYLVQTLPLPIQVNAIVVKVDTHD